MSSYHFTFSGLGLLAAAVMLLLIPLFFRYRQRQRTPFLYYSQVSDLPVPGKEERYQRWYTLPDKLFMACLICFALALVDMRLLMPPAPPGDSGPLGRPQIIKTPTEGIALYFVVDVSGSMGRAVPFDTSEGFQYVPKIDLMKRLTETFIAGRPNDLIGLVSFARQAQVLAPLTLDHDAVINQLRKLQIVTDPTQDGTGIGYAIYKTASTIAATRHFGEQLPKNQKPAYAIESTAMILVTDGFQSPSPLDKGNWMRTIGMEEAARFAKDQGIKLYLVDIEPSLAKAEFEPHRQLLARVAETTGGKFFLAESYNALPDIYSQIDALEKSSLPIETEVQIKEGPHREVPLYLLFVLAGMACFAVAVGLETLYLRVTP